MEISNLIKIAAEPHLIASATKANEILASLNAIITDLRIEVRDLELSSDLYYNQLMKGEGTVELKKSEWKVSEIYREFQKKKGFLSDVRSIRKALQRHADLLFEQEKFGGRNYGNYPRALE